MKDATRKRDGGRGKGDVLLSSFLGSDGLGHNLGLERSRREGGNEVSSGVSTSTHPRFSFPNSSLHLSATTEIRD